MSYGMSCTGASAGGAIAQLLANGAAAKYLNQDPTMTLWRFKYAKHTNFALESIQQTFNSHVAFGSNSQLTLNRTGDLAYWMYALIELPGIKACVPTAATCGIGGQSFPFCPTCDPANDGDRPSCDGCNGAAGEDAEAVGCDEPSGDYCFWVQSIGQFIVKQASLVIGGQLVNCLTNDFMFMNEELCGKAGKRLEEMVGRRQTTAALIADSMYARTLYTPLPFFFTQSSGNALALAALQFHGVNINIEWASLRDCVQVSGADVMVVKCDTCSPLTDNDLKATLDTTYVYLDNEERSRFAAGNFEQLITQVQASSTLSSSPQVGVKLNFNHPMIELMWGVRRQEMTRCNNHFNYSGMWGLDPIKTVSLNLNNQPRFTAREGKYFRTVQPYQHHSSIPSAYVYCFCFAVHPEEAQPSGAANFSRIDNVEMRFELQDDMFQGETAEQVTVIIFGRSINIYRFRNGLGGLTFNNKLAVTEPFQGELVESF